MHMHGRREGGQRTFLAKIKRPKKVFQKFFGIMGEGALKVRFSKLHQPQFFTIFLNI